jgi:hypothetical protein
MKKFLFLLVPFLLVTSTGFYYFFSSSPTEEIVTESLPTLGEITSLSTLENAYKENIQSRSNLRGDDVTHFRLALQDAEVKKCNKITSPDIKAKCLDTFIILDASHSQSIEWCRTLHDVSKKVTCTNQVYFAQAKAFKNTLLCKKIIGDIELQSICNENIGSLDSKITPLSARDFCTNTIDCQIPKKNNTPANIKALALEKQDISLCQSIESQTGSRDCSDDVTMELSFETKNIASCDNIQDAKDKSYCMNQMIYYNDRELYAQILKNKRSTLCSSIVTKSLRESCSDMLLLEKIKISGKVWDCDKLYATGAVIACKNLYK